MNYNDNIIDYDYHSHPLLSCIMKHKLCFDDFPYRIHSNMEYNIKYLIISIYPTPYLVL